MYKMAVRNIQAIVKLVENIHRNARFYEQNPIITSKSREYSFFMEKK